MPEEYDSKYKTWKLEDLPIIPKRMETRIIHKTRNQFNGIKQLAKRNDLKDLIIATDAGREGELVARWIIEKIQWKKPLKRLWIFSQTDKAIRDGFEQLKPAKQFESLYESAKARAEADWLIGLNVSRALTTKYNDPLSAGRVQTPTLGVILERDKEIQKFVPTPYWVLEANMSGLSALWHHKGEKRIFSEEKANSIRANVISEEAIVHYVSKKEKYENHPLPFDLNELQREANRRYGFSAKKTLSILQKLYEHHKLVTYPRTDSRYLTVDIKNTLYERIQALSAIYPEEVKPIIQENANVYAQKVFQNHKVTDHHAIIPTEERPNLDKLTLDEKKLYDLVVRGFFTLFYPKYHYETVTINFLVNGENFITTVIKTLNRGFKAVLNMSTEKEQSLPHLKEGTRVPIKNVHLKKGWTEAPLRYTEGDLLGKMESYGLGTPATRADIIEKLISSEVILREQNRLVPTPKGKQLIQLVNEELKSPELTAKWEKELEKIAKEETTSHSFLERIRKQTDQLVQEIKYSDKHYRAPNLTGSKCPECGSYLKERRGKDGRYLVCSNQDCQYRKQKDPKLSQKRCSQCHKRMEIHDGKAGKYLQCRFCNIVEKLDKRTGKLSKREEKKLLKKYSKQESFGNSLADALRAAFGEKED